MFREKKVISLGSLPLELFENSHLGERAEIGRVHLSFFKKKLFIFRERVREGETEGENINVWLPLMCPLLGTWPETQACALTGDQTGDSLVPRPALNPLSHTSQSL